MARERQPVKLSSPLHLHKCLSGAYTVILTVVPPRAGECRFVRVTSVLIFPRPRLVLLLCWREHPDGRSHLPAAGSRQDLRCAPRGPGVRPAAIDTPVPAGRRYPTATQRTGRPAGAGPHARLGRTTARTRRDSSSRQHTGPPPGGNARCAYCPSPATTHSKEKRLLSISKPHRTMLLCLSRPLSISVFGREARYFAAVLGADKTGMSHSGCGGQALTGNNHRMVGSSQPPPGGLAAGVAPHLGGIRWVLVTAPASDG